jgi:hypothetical protein
MLHKKTKVRAKQAKILRELLASVQVAKLGLAREVNKNRPSEFT